MKKLKIIAISYIVILSCISIAIINSCNSRNNNSEITYRINTTSYDKVIGYSKTTLDSLFNSGISAKVIDNNNYFIWNKLNKYKYSDSIMLWGPLTTYKQNYYTLNYRIINENPKEISFTLYIDLINKFHKPLTKVIFYPSWVSYNGHEGFIGVESLPEIEIKFKNCPSGKKFQLPILFTAQYNKIQSNPVLISVKADCYFDDKSFEEIMTFSVKNTWYKH